MNRDEAQKIVNERAETVWCGQSNDAVIGAICTLLATPAEAPADEPMPCVCGNSRELDPCRIVDRYEIMCLQCHRFRVSMPTREAAIRCWNALQREARR